MSFDYLSSTLSTVFPMSFMFVLWEVDFYKTTQKSEWVYIETAFSGYPHAPPQNLRGFLFSTRLVPIYTHVFVGYYGDSIRYKSVPIYTYGFVCYCSAYPISDLIDLSTEHHRARLMRFILTRRCTHIFPVSRLGSILGGALYITISVFRRCIIMYYFYFLQIFPILLLIT